MVWVIGLIVLILLIVSAWFRKVAVSVIIVTGVVGSLIYVLNEREEERALSRISLAELDFENVALKPSYSGYKLSGRIKNNSQEFTLKQVYTQAGQSADHHAGLHRYTGFSGLCDYRGKSREYGSQHSTRSGS